MKKNAFAVVGLVSALTGQACLADGDWTGAYVGGDVSLGTFTADVAGNNGSSSFDFDQSGYGIHAGYLWDQGALVYGAEVGFAKMTYDFGSSPGEAHLDELTVRGVIGYDLGDFLVYGAAGVTWSEVTTTINNALVNTDGPEVALGVTYQATDNMRLGLEVNGMWDAPFGGRGLVTARDKNVTLRASYNF